MHQKRLQQLLAGGEDDSSDLHIKDIVKGKGKAVAIAVLRPLAVNVKLFGRLIDKNMEEERIFFDAFALVGIGVPEAASLSGGTVMAKGAMPLKI